MLGIKKARKKTPTVCLIISAPRSGSTWLQTILNSHPQAFCTEHRLFGQFFEVWPDNSTANSPRITLDRYVSVLTGYYRFDALGLSGKEFEREFLRYMIQCIYSFAVTHSEKKLKIQADKITPYLNSSAIVAEAINTYFKHAKVVQLVRDGRDVLTSGVFDWMERKDEGTARHKHFVKKESGVELRRFFTDQDISTWATYWNESIATVDAIDKTPHVVKFEDMKTDQFAVLAELFDFLGLDDSSSVILRCIEQSTFKKMSSGRKAGEMDPTAKTRKGVVGDWRNYFTMRDGKYFETLCSRNLQRWEYERDSVWIDSLSSNLEISEKT